MGMVSDLFKLDVRTSRRNELIDITRQVNDVVRRSKVKRGICVVYVPHTTAAVTINENADPSVKADISNTLSKLVPAGAGYSHMEGNADSHIKTVLTGPSVTLMVEDGKLLLGTWQGVFFCEYDGPRSRRVFVRVIGE